MNLVYNSPVKIVFGSHKLKDLYNILKDGSLSNGMLVCDPYFINTGLANKVMHYSKGLLTDIFFDIKPNPTINSVDKCADIIRSKDIRFLAVIGGGSALDCAKAAASVCNTSLSIVQFHSGNRNFTDSHIPVIAIPTTAGTGSEVSNKAVLTDPIIGMKSPIVCDNFYPAIAIVDPVLTLTMPPKATASTGFDALSHALEAFWSRYHKPESDELAAQSAKLIFENLYKAYMDGSDLETREKMSEASVLAGLAVNISSVTACHACSYPLTNLYNIRHGEACAFTLDSFLRINSEAEDGRLHQFAKRIGFKDVHDMADEIVKMKVSMEMKSTLKEARIDASEIDNLAILSMQPDMINNPIFISIDDLIQMYHSLNK